MPKAVAVGERHLILGFKGVGMEIVPAQEKDEVHRELMRLARDPEVGLVLVTESMAAESPASLDEFRAVSAGILTVIPTHEGSQHVSFDLMKKAIERSIGVDILGKD